MRGKRIKISHFRKHETKQHILFKFLGVLFIFAGYLGFIVYKYGLENGIMITALTWSFFVLCTPIADAGFLIDFPLRLITRIKMLYSEIIVWLIAISLNLYAFFQKPEHYEKTELLKLFKHILDEPIPFWTIIIISLIGTFLSIFFGDELFDTASHSERKIHAKHKHNHNFIIMIFVLGITLVLYDFLLKKLGVNLPL